MRNPCFNPLALLDYSCEGCQFTAICECDLRIINGKKVNKKKKNIPAPENPPVEVKKEVEKPVAEKKKVLLKINKVIEFDLDI